jgi:deoxyribodipyrimidine photo-lyase
MSSAIWWIRRDLRLSDNQALSAALLHGGSVFPVFILDPSLISSRYCGQKRLSFLFDGLRALDISLRDRGSYLLLRSGTPALILNQLLQKTSSDVIYAEEDYSPYAVSRDRPIVESFPLTLFPGLTVHHPKDILKPNRTPYTVFTPFKNAWQARGWNSQLLPAPRQIPTPPGIPSEAIPVGDPNLKGRLFSAGELEAQHRLDTFIGGHNAPVFTYEENRNRLDFEETSMLSPYLRFGMLSARQALNAAWQAEARAWDQSSHRGTETWLNELIWREFYQSILYHFPEVRCGSFRPEMSRIRWINDEAHFSAWKDGQTGYPIVDAAMRQLVQEGWMHNRVRMIVASFLTKDLSIDWRWGERHFMQHLVDGDPAANNGGWQWVAGTGIDAAPYFRVFNPVLQSKKFDPDGTFIRRFVPELERVPMEFIHEPWKMPFVLQKEIGCIIGKDYPVPIVDHSMTRKRVLNAYKLRGE